jgi:hypothetical protein
MKEKTKKEVDLQVRNIIIAALNEHLRNVHGFMMCESTPKDANDAFAYYEKKMNAIKDEYSEKINRVWAEIESEAFIDKIIERINRKQLK